jgi:hypothetical protein
VRRLLTLGQPHRNTAIQAHLQDRRPLALVVALVLCLFAFVLSSNEAWAVEQASSTEQQPPPTTGESTIIVNGTQVATPTPMPMPPPVSTTPPVETPPTEALPQPPSNSVNSVLFKAEPEPAAQPAAQPTPLQSTVVVTNTASETVGPSVEPASALQQSEPAPPTKTPSTTPSGPAPVSVSAALTPDLGSPEIQEVPAAAEEVPAEGPAAAPPTGLSSPSEVSEPVIPGPALQQQQVAHGVASPEQAGPDYSSLWVAPASIAVQPHTQGLTNFVGTSAAAVANAAANILGTVGGWLAAEAPASGDEDSSSSSSSSGDTTMPEPFAPVSPQPLGSSFISLFSGGGAQSSAGGAGATVLLGVLFLASTLLVRRDLRMYLVSCEVPKPSSALLSPLERPG